MQSSLIDTKIDKSKFIKQDLVYLSFYITHCLIDLDFVPLRNN